MNFGAVLAIMVIAAISIGIFIMASDAFPLLERIAIALEKIADKEPR